MATYISFSHWFGPYGMDPGAEHERELVADAYELVTVVAVPSDFVPAFEPPSPLPPVPVLAGQQVVGASPPFRELTVVNFRMGLNPYEHDSSPSGTPQHPIVRFTVRNTGTLKLYAYELIFSFVVSEFA